MPREKKVKSQRPSNSTAVSPAPSTHSSGEQQQSHNERDGNTKRPDTASSSQEASGRKSSSTADETETPAASIGHTPLPPPPPPQASEASGGPPPLYDKNGHPTPSFVPFHHPSSNMPHRVEPYAINYAQRRAHNSHYDLSRHRPSPPPIATLTNSPSLSASSLDRSSAVSTPNPTGPAGRRSPPSYQGGGYPMYTSAYGHHPGHFPHPPPLHAYRAHPYPLPAAHHLGSRHPAPPPPHPSHYPQGGYAGGYDPGYDSRYGPPPPGMDPQMHSPYGMHHSHSHHMPPPHHGGMPAPDPNAAYPTAANAYPMPGQNGIVGGPHGNIGYGVSFTDDAATKLSDKVRRRCFNCCTTDTSTWRRSNLNPGKVLCNKCGLFERTHSRPRPEQFPHKRGPLASSTLAASVSASRSPPSQHQHPSSMAHDAGHAPPPYHYASNSASAPVDTKPRVGYANGGGPLPTVQSWHHDSHSHGSPHAPPASHNGATRSPPSAEGMRRDSNASMESQREIDLRRGSRTGSPIQESRSHASSVHTSPKDGMQSRTLTPPLQQRVVAEVA